MARLGATDFRGTINMLGNSIINPLGIKLVIPSSDHSYSGIVITGTANEAQVIGDVCYLNSSGKFAKADADAEATAKGMIAVATGTIAADATGIYLLYGLLRDDTWTWTQGNELWISTTPGNPTATKPSGSGDIVRLVGYAFTADVIFVDPDKTYVEIA